MDVDCKLKTSGFPSLDVLGVFCLIQILAHFSPQNGKIPVAESFERRPEGQIEIKRLSYCKFDV